MDKTFVLDHLPNTKRHKGLVLVPGRANQSSKVLDTEYSQTLEYTPQELKETGEYQLLVSSMVLFGNVSAWTSFTYKYGITAPRMPETIVETHGYFSDEVQPITKLPSFTWDESIDVSSGFGYYNVYWNSDLDTTGPTTTSSAAEYNTDLLSENYYF